LGLEAVWRSGDQASFAAYHSEVAEFAWQDFTASVREGLIVFDSGVYAGDPRRVIGVHSLLTSRIAASLGAYVMARGLPTARERRQTLSETAKRLRAWVQGTNTLVPARRLAGRTKALLVGWERFHARLLRMAVKVAGGSGAAMTHFGSTRLTTPEEVGWFISAVRGAQSPTEGRLWDRFQ
jgi:hypothetical protein